jgi:hypothetical protein
MLVLNVLRGLNHQFSYLGALIQRQRPFPTFAEVKSDLRLAEINMATKPAQLPQAFAASTPTSPVLPLLNSGGTSGGRKPPRCCGGKKTTGGRGPGAAPTQAPWRLGLAIHHGLHPGSRPLAHSRRTGLAQQLSCLARLAHIPKLSMPSPLCCLGRPRRHICQVCQAPSRLGHLCRLPQGLLVPANHLLVGYSIPVVSPRTQTCWLQTSTQ